MLESEKLAEAKAALDALCLSKKRRFETQFSELFQSIKHALERGESRGAVLDVLKICGLEMSQARFKKLFEAEEKRLRGQGPAPLRVR